MTFRVEKNNNYTIMCNHHLQNRKLTLKAKGLLSIMLSLPENWDYSLKGLAAICMEGVDSIRSALNELEAEGYIKRNKIRKPSGQWGSEYVIYETPHHEESLPSEKEEADILPAAKEPDNTPEVLPDPADAPDNLYNKTAASNAENTTLENPTRSNSTRLDFTTWSKPTRLSQHGSANTENPTQLNTNNKILNNNINNTYLSNQSNLSNQSCLAADAADEMDRSVHEQIDYESLIEEHPEDADVIDGIVDIMLQYYDLPDDGKLVYVGGFAQSPAAVKKRLKKLTKEHIVSVLTGIKQSNKPVRHYKAYILASLLNAPCSLNAQSNRTGSPVHRQAPNRFHNFEQRDVDYEDMKFDITQYLK